MRGDQESEAIREKHSALALKLLEDAEREIAAGDTVQGGEKLWGATSQALKAYCASHGLPHGGNAHRRRALLDLAERTGDGFLPMAFGTAESCHANFYNDWMDQEHLETYLPGIQRLVRQLLDVRQVTPEGTMNDRPPVSSSFPLH